MIEMSCGLAPDSSAAGGRVTSSPAAKIKVDRAWIGAPDSALIGNPTVWLFVAATATLALTTVYHLRGTLTVVPTVALNAVAIYVLFTVMHDAVHRTAHGWLRSGHRYQRAFRATRPELDLEPA